MSDVNKVEDVDIQLKSLFPSTRGSSSKPSYASAQSLQKKPETALILPAPVVMCHTNPGHSVSQEWGKTSNTKRKFSGKFKSAGKKTEKVFESLKDIFFIIDPSVSTVPRKADRQFYYQNNLVASAVKFNSTMNETDV